jgi:4-hydroxythreonine-4-phosphate dehydrogenase
MGETTSTIRLAVTAGDPFGIGPEVVRAALAEPLGADVTVYGDPDRLGAVEARVVAVPAEGAAPEPPGPSEPGGRASLAALDRALDDIRSGQQDALVTGPISKESWALAGGPPDGHTPYLGHFFDAEPLMAFVWDEAEPVVALLTTHIPLRAVPATLTSEKVERAVRALADGLRGRLGREAPRIGVCGLNPHAGEQGLLGTEEADFVEPALERLRADGLDVTGPLPGDTAFAVRSRFDGILALYHDQGLAPVKALAFDRAVNLTLGLPIVRTSPAHGTAFDLAGTGRADPSSMRAALTWAVKLASAR